MAKRKRRSPFGFGSWDEDFDRIREDMDRMLEDMLNELQGIDFEQLKELKRKGPHIHGFSIKIGPDGKPVVREFGDKPILSEKGIKKARVPLVDTIIGKKTLKAIFELPGVSKHDIHLNSTEDTLIVTVDTPGRKFSKEVNLSRKVKPLTAKASYKNGVLEVELELKSPKRKTKESGHKVKIN